MCPTDVSITNKHIKLFGKKSISTGQVGEAYFVFIDGEPRIPATVFDVILTRRLGDAYRRIAELTKQIEVLNEKYKEEV